MAFASKENGKWHRTKPRAVVATAGLDLHPDGAGVLSSQDCEVSAGLHRPVKHGASAEIPTTGDIRFLELMWSDVQDFISEPWIKFSLARKEMLRIAP